MKNFIYIVLIFLFFDSVQVLSLPRLALRLKDKCSSCHVNPTGGLIRNENGWYYGKYPMSMISPREKDFTQSPKITDNIILGVDIRGQYLYSQEKSRTDFQNMAGAIYASIQLSEKIDVVTRYDYVNSIWEAYAIAHVLPLDGYIKGGTFQPNFGIRIDDHTAYTRGGDFAVLRDGGLQGLQYDPFYLESGVELGFNFGDMAFLTASVGSPNDKFTFENDPSYTARLELTPSIDKLGLLFGGSFSNSKTKVFPPPNFTPDFLNTNVYGGFAGVGYKRFSVMAEYDMAENLMAEEVKSTAIMAKASYQIMVGLEVIARYDMFDPNTDVDKDELAHLIFGFEFFPYSFVEIRPQYRLIMEDPSKDNDAFVLQFHIWY